MVKSLGANTVIDYKKEDFTQDGQTYDIIFDAVGRNVTSYAKCKNSLTKDGIFVTIDPQSTIFRYMLNKKVRGYMGGVNGEKLDSLREIIEAGKVKSFVDKVYSLSQVAEVHRCYEVGQKKGKIGIEVLE